MRIGSGNIFAGTLSFVAKTAKVGLTATATASTSRLPPAKRRQVLPKLDIRYAAFSATKNRWVGRKIGLGPSSAGNACSGAAGIDPIEERHAAPTKIS